jgi:hypothetical protein
MRESVVRVNLDLAKKEKKDKKETSRAGAQAFSALLRILDRDSSSKLHYQYCHTYYRYNCTMPGTVMNIINTVYKNSVEKSAKSLRTVPRYWYRQYLFASLVDMHGMA